MTVYTCNISTTPANASGETTTSISTERINDHSGSNFVSSEDFGSTGPTVLDGRPAQGALFCLRPIFNRPTSSKWLAFP